MTTKSSISPSVHASPAQSAEPCTPRGKAKIKPKSDAMFLPYQEAWIKDVSQLKLMEKSRQIGMSWSSAYSLVRRKSLVGAALDAWISSRDEIQARLFLDDCKAFAKILNFAAVDMGSELLEDKATTNYVLAMANGLKLNSMSSNPDAQAGKRGDRLLDEFALHKDPRKLYSIAYPGITWGGQMEIVSTHRGTDNFFNELVREIKEKGNPKNFSLHTVTLQKALDQGFLFKLQSKLPPNDPRQQMDEAEYYDFIRSACVDEETFQQEYMCVPVDGNSVFLTWDLITGAEYDATEKWEYESPDSIPKDDSIYIGVDVGRHHDLTVIWINSYNNNRHMTRKIIELKKMKFSQQEAELYPWIARAERTCIDATGLGEQFAERAQEKFGSYRVEGVKFTPASKESLAYPLRNAMEDRNFKIPFSQNLRQDFRGIKKETTAAGNIRFAGERGDNGHSDRFWAAALSIHAATTGNLGPCRFESARATAETNHLPGGRDSVEPSSYDYHYQSSGGLY
ncbi:MAG: hypothetical protein L3J71_03575 [Victivallaceae bacterium]|nr:hypothetical protein [Victivallaceae bacterium]